MRYVRLLAGIAAAMLLCSCGDYTDVEELGVVAGLAIDKGEGGGYRVTAEIAQPSPDPKEGPVIPRIVESSGSSLMGAVSGLTGKIPERVYLRHCSLALIGEELANEGVDGIVNTFMSLHDFTSTIVFGVAKNCDAADIFGLESERGLISKEISDTIRQQQNRLGKIAANKLYTLYNSVKGGGDMFLPAIRLIAEENEEDGNGAGKKIPEPYGIAVFKNSKMEGYLDPDESQLCIMATGDFRSGAKDYMDLTEGEHVSVNIVRSETKLMPFMQAGKPAMRVLLDMEGTVINTKDSLHGVFAQVDKELSEKIEKRLSEEILHVVNKTREKFGADIFGFGISVHNRYRGFWNEIGGYENWRPYYKGMTVVVEPRITIRNDGLIGEGGEAP